MGASLDTRTFKINDKNTIAKQWSKMVVESRHLDGLSYSGCIGMLSENILWYDKRFATPNKAEDFLCENHHKGEPTIAVSFYLPFDPSSKQVFAHKEAQEIANKARRHFDILLQTILKEIHTLPSGFIQCPLCHSTLNVLKLTSIRCPLCPGKLRAPADIAIYDDAGYLTTQEQTNILEDVATTTRRAIDAALEAAKLQLSDQIGWLVGGWCSS